MPGRRPGYLHRLAGGLICRLVGQPPGGRETPCSIEQRPDAQTHRLVGGQRFHDPVSHDNSFLAVLN
jgi:hypothetical protein